jgi:hypothetical protein
MAAKKPPAATQTIVNNQNVATIFEEADTFEDLTPRMQELLLTTTPGTRIYLRVRDRRIIN